MHWAALELAPGKQCSCSRNYQHLKAFKVGLGTVGCHQAPLSRAEGDRQQQELLALLVLSMDGEGCLPPFLLPLLATGLSGEKSRAKLVPCRTAGLCGFARTIHAAVDYPRTL